MYITREKLFITIVQTVHRSNNITKYVKLWSNVMFTI